jgi:hypothetical protein
MFAVYSPIFRLTVGLLVADRDGSPNFEAEIESGLDLLLERLSRMDGAVQGHRRNRGNVIGLVRFENATLPDRSGLDRQTHGELTWFLT